MSSVHDVLCVENEIFKFGYFKPSWKLLELDSDIGEVKTGMAFSFAMLYVGVDIFQWIDILHITAVCSIRA